MSRRPVSIPFPSLDRGAVISLAAGLGLLGLGIAGFTSTLPYRAGLVERAPLAPAPDLARWSAASVFTDEASEPVPERVTVIDEAPQSTATTAAFVYAAPSPPLPTRVPEQPAPVETQPIAAAAAEPVKPLPTATPTLSPLGSQAPEQEPLPAPGTRGYTSPFAFPEELPSPSPAEPEPASQTNPGTPAPSNQPVSSVGTTPVGAGGYSVAAPANTN